MKNLIQTLMLTWVFIPCGLAQAQTINPELLQGSDVTLNGQSYLLLSKVRSVEIPHCDAALNGPIQLENLGIEGHRFLTAKQNQAIYETQTIQNNLTLDTTLQGSQRHPVLYNARSKKLAVLTGKVSIKVTRNDQASALANKFNLQIHRHFPHLRLVIFQVAAEQNISSLVKRLKKDVRVKRVRVDLLENLPQAN